VVAVRTGEHDNAVGSGRGGGGGKAQATAGSFVGPAMAWPRSARTRRECERGGRGE
jgi:hypothetical protein